MPFMISSCFRKASSACCAARLLATDLVCELLSAYHCKSVFVLIRLFVRGASKDGDAVAARVCGCCPNALGTGHQ